MGDRIGIGRSRARWLAFVVAALAVAGTTASPPPPPLATASASGKLEVTSEEPIASIVVSFAANDAALSVPLSRLQTSVQAGSPGDPSAPAIVIVEPLDSPGASAAYGSQASQSGTLDPGCAAPQTCASDFRITAVLVDPDAERASIDWQAEVSLHTSGEHRATTAPSGARLDVEPGAVTRRPASELARTSLKPETVHLDADRPLVRRTISLDQPPGPVGVGEDRVWLAFLSATPADRSAYPPAGVELTAAGQRGQIVGQVLGWTPFFLPQCPGDDRCTSDLQLDLRAPGSAFGVERELTWSMVVVTFGPTGARRPDAPELAVQAAPAIGPDSPRLTATQSGSFDVEKGRNHASAPVVSLDATAIGQGGGPRVGQLQVRVEMRATGAGGGKPLNIGVGNGNGQESVPGVNAQIAAGEHRTLVTQVVELSCDGRASCALAAPIFAVAPEAGPAVHIDWILTAIWFPDSGTVPDGLRLSIVDGPASAAP